MNKKRRVGKLIRLFFLAVILLALGNFLFRIPSWVGAINKPFEQIHSNLASNSRINNQSRTNILLLLLSDRDELKEAAIASFNPSRDNLSIIEVPVEAQVYSGGGKFMSLKVAYSEKPYFNGGFDSTYTLLKELTALPIDGYFVFQGGEVSFSQGSIDATKKKMALPGFLFKFLSYRKWLDVHMKTDYSLTNIFRLAQSFKGLGEEKIQYFDLATAVGSNEQFDIQSVDNALKEAALDNNVSNENALVEINSNIGASLLARVVDNLGTSSLSFGGAEPKTKVIAGSDKQRAAQRIADFLGVKLEMGKISSGADVKVILGDDFGKIFYGK